MRHHRQLLPVFVVVVIVFLVWNPGHSSSRTAIQQSAASFGLTAGRNVNMVSGITLPGGDPWLQRQNEPSIAVSTRNPRHLLAGANDYRTVDYPLSEGELPGLPESAQAQGDAWLGMFASFDGGESWVTTLLPGFPQDTSASGSVSPLKNYGTAADPVVRAGAAGLFFYSGIAFRRQAPVSSCVFVARLIDDNNTESGSPIRFLDTSLIQTGASELQFIDKPWIAVDKPRGSGTVSIGGETVPAFNVYLVYSLFYGAASNSGGTIMFSRSTSSGQSWDVPIKLAETNGKQGLNQGACVAVDPASGAVHVAWRNFDKNLKRASIYAVKSANGGQSFGTPVEVAKNLKTFDQGTSTITFRTNAYPTLAVDQNGIVYLAWSERLKGNKSAATVMLTTSAGGSSWSKPWAVEAPGSTGGPEGHQFMPALTFASGRLVLAWLDQRDDVSGMVTEYIDESYPIRRTVDVRAAVGRPGLVPLFEPSIQVSRYLYVLVQAPGGGYGVQQAQFNPPDYPLFKGGTSPFHGDYLDVAASPPFVLKNGAWEFSTDDTETPTYHVAWTDNRDVRPPADNNWTNYTPPSSNQGAYGNPGCSPAVDRMGMRNQNIYTAKLSRIEAGVESNYRTLGYNLGFYPSGEIIPRAFVLYVKNPTEVSTSFRMSFSAGSSIERVSFEEFKDVSSLDVEIAPYSSISRPLYVSSTNAQESVTVFVAEIDRPGGSVVPGGLTSTVVINPDPENPLIPEGDPAQFEETHTPSVANPSVMSWSVINPSVLNPSVMSPSVANPSVMNPSVANPSVMSPSVANPSVANPNVMSPSVANPSVANSNILNPSVANPSVMSASLDGAEVRDVTWKVTNSGNTSSSYAFKMYSKKQIPAGIYSQLLVYRIHKVPGVLYSPESSGTVADCKLREEEQHELLLNVPNPNVFSTNVANPSVMSPSVANPSVQNATFSIPPGEDVIAVLRLIDPSPGLVRTLSARTASSVDDFIDSIGAAATAQTLNTEEARIGDTSPAVAATKLVIGTVSLPDGVVGQAYERKLEAAGGIPPYFWALNAGQLPAGLTLGGDGAIGGVPTQAGMFVFIVEARDAGGGTDTQSYSIAVDSDQIPDPLAITTPAPLPGGVLGYWYGTTLEATGGVWPRTWSLVSGSLPGGLALDENGVISGTPTATGAFSFTARVTDAAGLFEDRLFGLSIQATTGTTVVISGTVRQDAVPIAGVVIRGFPDTPMTGPDGTYAVSVPQGWTGTAVPFKVGYEFTPSERTYTNVLDNSTGQDYGASDVLVSEGWVARYNGPAEACLDYPMGMVLDSSGNVYVAGYGEGGITRYDFATVKYDGSGNRIWVNRNIGAAYDSIDICYGLANDAAGNIYLTGSSYADISVATYQATTVKYDRAGNLIWVARHPIAPGGYEEGNAIALDAAGNIYIAGLASTGTDPGRILILKYNSFGQEQWARVYPGGGSTRDSVAGIAVDSSGNVYVAGNTTIGTQTDFLLLKYDAGGTEQWARTYDGTANGPDSVVGVRIDPSDKPIVAGTALFLDTGMDIVLIAYNPADGSPAWVTRYNRTAGSSDYGRSMTLDAAGNIYVTGSSGNRCLTAKFTNAGSKVWDTVAADPGVGDYGQAVCVDASGFVYAAGVSAFSGERFSRVLTAKYKPNGEVEWAVTDDGGCYGSDYGEFLAVDSSGNVFVSGTSLGASTGQDYLTIKYDGSGVKQWARRYNGPTNDDTVIAAVVDSAGNTYVASADCGVGTFSDMTTVKFDASGSQPWEARYDGPDHYVDTPAAIGLDAAGNVYVCGYSSSTTINRLVLIKYDPATAAARTTIFDAVPVMPRAMHVDPAGSVTITGYGLMDVQTLRFDAAGTLLWRSAYNGPDNRSDQGWSVKADASGNAYVLARRQNFALQYETILIKYDPSGAEVWAQAYLAAPLSTPLVLSVDAAGNSYIAAAATSGNQTDGLILKYDTGGTLIWAVTYDGPDHLSEMPMAISVDAGGNVYVAGGGARSATRDDFLTVKYSGAGVLQWAAYYDCSGIYDRANSLAVDAAGNVYVAGQSQGPEKSSDFATVKYDANGQFVWVARYNGPGHTTDYATYVGLDALGFVYSVGSSIGLGGAGFDLTVVKYRQR